MHHRANVIKTLILKKVNILSLKTTSVGLSLKSLPSLLLKFLLSRSEKRNVFAVIYIRQRRPSRYIFKHVSAHISVQNFAFLNSLCNS